MGKMKEILMNATTPFTTVDTAIEEAFDNRQRFDYDDELDSLSMHLAYEETIKAHGWTVTDYEYVFNRASDDAEEQQDGYASDQQDEDEDSHDLSDLALDGTEEGGGPMGDCHG
jgi:hypothetical protein